MNHTSFIQKVSKHYRREGAPDVFCQLVRCLSLVVLSQPPSDIQLAKPLVDITRSISLLVQVLHAGISHSVPVDLFPKLVGNGQFWSVSPSGMTSDLFRS